jgi:predicted transposase YbfD/YdcC
MEDFVEIRMWGELRLDFLRRFYPYERGLLAHDTLNDVLNALDPELLQACFSEWVESLRQSEPDIVAIDGKTSRRSHARAKGREPLPIMSAWAARQRLVLGQEAIADKSNEIRAIPALLERLDLNGALVTIDAMGTQTDIAEKIVAGGGDYLLSLKANWPVLLTDVEDFFADPQAERDRTRPSDNRRRPWPDRRTPHLVSDNVDWLVSDRRYSGEPRFPHLAMIAMVETRVERNGAEARERRYYLSSAKLDAEVFALGLRAHWGVENRLHWVLDVVFHDDLVRLRTGNGPRNMAVIRHMNMNLIRAKDDRHSLKTRRKRANLSPDYLEDVI